MEKSMKDIVLMLPDGILYGSLFFGLITLSQQHLIFFASLLEGLFVLNGFQTIASFINGNSRTDPEKCRSGFQGLTFTQFNQTIYSDSISYGVYLVSLASTYFIGASTALKDELEVLNPSYMDHSTMTMYLLLAITLIYAIIKVFMECDSLTSVSLALILGTIMGILLIYQNVHIFDKNAVNFLGIPLLRNKTADNKPIYICSQ